MKKKLLPLLLAFSLLLSMLPADVLAADPQDATVYVSVVQEGDFVTGTDGQVMAHAPVALSGEAPTLSDAFTAAHETYYADGTSGYEDADGYVSKFWGVSSYNVGYYNNNSYAMGTTDPVSDGAHVVFWFYQDTTSWSDTYTYFDQTTADVSGGEALTLTASMADLAITVDGEAVPGKTTAEDGTVTLYFAQEGTYRVSATSDAVIVPPVCIVTVTGDDAGVEAAVQSDCAALTLPEHVTDNLTLPTVGASGKTSITWTSDNAAITDQGVVTRAPQDQTVTLTAALFYGGFAQERTFLVTVPALSGEEMLVRAKAALESASIVPQQYNEDFSGPGDTNILPVIQRAVDGAVSGVTVSGLVSSDHENIAADGTITYGQETTGTVTVTLTCGDLSQTAAVSVTVPEAAQTRQSVMDQAAADLGAVILDENTGLDNICSDLNFTSVTDALGYYVQAEWSIPEEGAAYLDRYGDVTRPAYGQEDVRFLLTCTLSWYTMMESYMPSGYVGPVPANKTVTYELTIKAITEEEYNAAKAAVDEALAALDGSVITLFADTSVTADLTAVTENLMLPAAEGFTSGTQWTTSDPAVIEAPSYNTGRAVVHRPVMGESAASCELTVTLSRDSYSASKTFTAAVPALTQEEIDAVNAQIQTIGDALTFDLIKKNNTSDTYVTSQLDFYKSASLDGTGTIQWSKAASPLTGFLISWTCTPEGVFDTYGYVTRPEADTAVTLTATITSADKPYASALEKQITVTVPVEREANTTAELDAILANIAAGYVDSTGEWIVLDMAAYEDTTPEAASKTSDTAKQAYIDYAIGSVSGESVGETAWSKAILALQAIGADPQTLYPENSTVPISAVAGLKAMESHSSSAWVAPYTLAAFNQGEYGAEETEQAIIASLLANQAENGSWSEWGDSIQTTANLIAALAFYYGTDETVTAAVDKAVAYLSSAQKADGTFDAYGSGPDANTAAMVVIGLSAVGVNPDADGRFIKGGVSALDSLLAFALADNSGFGYTNNTALNSGATEQGFRALVAARQVMSTGAAYNVYDFSATEVSPAYADGKSDDGEQGGGSGDSSQEEITVSFELKTHQETWIEAHDVTVAEDATVADLFHQVLDSREEFSYVDNSGYIRSITYGDTTWAEFDAGRNSGWKYMVNGVAPSVGMKDKALAEGDAVVWYYVTDYTQDTDRDEGSHGMATPVNPVKPFTDVKGHWGYEAIEYCYDAGLMSGTSETTFAPDAILNRAMLVTILYALEDKPQTDGDAPFTDVADGVWYTHAVLWAAEEGIVSGYGDGTFGPLDALTREQLAAILWRYAQFKERDVSVGEDTNILSYTDAFAISDWAFPALQWACGAGLMGGYNGKLMPQSQATRAQMATILMNYLENVK